MNMFGFELCQKDAQKLSKLYYVIVNCLNKDRKEFTIDENLISILKGNGVSHSDIEWIRKEMMREAYEIERNEHGRVTGLTRIKGPKVKGWDRNDIGSFEL